MAHRILKQFAFMGKSIIWSLLLYTVLMLVINWDEVSNTMSGARPATIVVNIATDTGADNAGVARKHAGLLKDIFYLIKSISGLASVFSVRR